MWPNDRYCCSNRAKTPSHTVTIRLSRQERIAMLSAPQFKRTVSNVTLPREASEVSWDFQDFRLVVKQHRSFGHRCGDIWRQIALNQRRLNGNVKRRRVIASCVIREQQIAYMSADQRRRTGAASVIGNDRTVLVVSAEERIRKAGQSATNNSANCLGREKA
jgi:hypothetical protein